MKMCEDSAGPRSSFVELSLKEHVTLLPSYLGRVGEGVTELLASRVLLYHAAYKGVLLSFSNVLVLQKAGHIFDELPHIHIDIQYSVVVFRPQIGNVMCGHVNNVGVDHIGCLLFDCFNTSVTCSPLPQQSAGQFQRRLASWASREFASGEQLLFSVTAVEVTGSLLALRGEYLLHETEEEEEELPKKKKKKKPEKEQKVKKKAKKGAREREKRQVCE